MQSLALTTHIWSGSGHLSQAGHPTDRHQNLVDVETEQSRGRSVHRAAIESGPWEGPGPGTLCTRLPLPCVSYASASPARPGPTRIRTVNCS